VVPRVGSNGLNQTDPGIADAVAFIRLRVVRSDGAGRDGQLHLDGPIGRFDNLRTQPTRCCQMVGLPLLRIHHIYVDVQKDALHTRFHRADRII
jgi:hypothetical protein